MSSNYPLLDSIPLLSQRQDSTNEQLIDLLSVAVRLGMYEAADLLKEQFCLSTTNTQANEK